MERLRNGQVMATFPKKYKLIHTYPEGSYLFHTATEPMTTLPMPPTSWDVDVFLADSTVEERETQSTNDCMITAKLKIALASLGGKYNPKNYKPHQPRFEVDKEYISTVNDADLLVLNPIIQSHPLLKFTTMLDNGATKWFIDDSFVSAHKLPTHQPQHRIQIVMADGRVIAASRGCTLPLTFDTLATKVTFIITKLQDRFDAVLGLDFLNEHNPHIDWQKATLTFDDNQHIKCTSKPREADAQIVHANSMARMMKRNAKNDNGNVYFCAILKHCDATTQEFDVDALNCPD